MPMARRTPITALSRARSGVRGRPRASTQRTRAASANLTRTKTSGGAVSIASRFTMNVDPQIAVTTTSTRSARRASPGGRETAAGAVMNGTSCLRARLLFSPPDDGPSRAFRALPDRLPPRGRRPHGALQLALRAPAWRHVHPPDRGHRRRKEPPRADGPDPPCDALAGPRLGRGPFLPERAEPSLSRGGGPPPRRGQGLPRVRDARGARRDQEGRGGGRERLPLRRPRARDPEGGGGRRAAAGEKFVLRLRVPDETLVVDDVVQGKAEFPAGALDDFVLVRSDGHPLYHFTVCVDDVAMGITHVIRGVDHLPNAPKHVALFRALGAPAPVFAHLGMILGADGKKLSKRHGAAGVEEFQAQGYLPDALDNFLALLGWSPGEDKERMTLTEMVSLFSLERIGPSPSRFDHEKLLWLNGQYLQEIPVARLAEMLKPFHLPKCDAVLLDRAILLHRSRARTLAELAHALVMYDEDPRVFEPAGLKKFSRPETASLLRTLAERLSITEPFSHSALEESVRALAAEKGRKLGDLAQPARLALTGVLASPPLFEMIEVLGKETTRRRLLAFADRIADRVKEPGRLG